MIARTAEQRLGMRKWELARYTLTQLLNALDAADPADPHAGGVEVPCLSVLDKLWG